MQSGTTEATSANKKVVPSIGKAPVNITALMLIFNWKALFHRKIKSSFFNLRVNPEILVKLFNLIYNLIVILTLTPQLSPNPNCKLQIKCVRMNIAYRSFSLF